MPARIAAAFFTLLVMVAATWQAYSTGRSDGRALEREVMSARALQATQAARAEEQKRAAMAQKVAHETQKNLARARADADAAADAGRRLREQLATFPSCRAAPHDSDPAAPGHTAQSAAHVLADVQLRLDEAADAIARFADEAHASGLACQQIHQGLN